MDNVRICIIYVLLPCWKQMEAIGSVVCKSRSEYEWNEAQIFHFGTSFFTCEITAIT